MNIRKRALALGLVGVAATAAVTFGVVKAFATPGAGAVGTIVARGSVPQDVVIGVPQTVTMTRPVAVRVGRRVVRKRVRFRVDTVRRLSACGSAGGCDIAFQQMTIPPGGHTGWHTHPGPTMVSIAQGEGTLYHGVAGCPSHRYGAGSSFFQPSTEVHNFRNEGSTNIVLYALFYLPAGTPNTGIRIDQPQPSSCPSIP